MPAGVVGFADLIQHRGIFRVHVNSQVVGAREVWGTHIINVDRHQEEVVIASNMGVARPSSWKAPELLHGFSRVVLPIVTDRPVEFFP